MVDGPVICIREDCNEPIVQKLNGPPRLYHSASCRVTACRRRKRARENPQPKWPKQVVNGQRRKGAASLDGRGSARRGPRFEEFIAEGWADDIASSRFTIAEVADETGYRPSDISRWMAAYVEDKAAAARRASRKPPKGAQEALDDFVAFRDRYFRYVNQDTGAAEPYVNKPFHLKWIAALVDASDNARRQCILSPPRHGKTDLLEHFVIWLICRNPNVRVLWLAKSKDMAEKVTFDVKTHLETNEALVADFGPFKPVSRTGLWAKDEFTVTTRTVQLRSPTMVAVGAGGTVLSRDVDFLVADDIEDFQNVQQPTERAKTKRWWSSDVTSRKQKHTGWVAIGSRQDPDDLYNALLDNSQWRVIVETAHSEACTIPWEVPPEVDAELAGLSLSAAEERRKAYLDSVHHDCMLFPEANPFSWLMEQREGNVEDGEMSAARFEMVYLNRPRPEGFSYFTREAVYGVPGDPDRVGCLDRHRSVGHVPPGTQLIAGLDPAPKGFQAAILWAVDVRTGVRYLVDLDNERAGGTPHMRWILADWSERYHVKTWVIEENYRGDTVETDEQIIATRHKHGLVFPPFGTYRNKNDPNLGVSSMVPLFENSKINLPYADSASRAKVEVYANQLINWRPLQGRQGHKHWKADLVMAGWFPEVEIRRMRRNRHHELRSTYVRTPLLPNIPTPTRRAPVRAA